MQTQEVATKEAPVVGAASEAGADGLTVRVAEKRRISRDTVALVLSSLDGAGLPSWTPGAHIDLVLPNGRTPQYSLCSSPRHDATWRVAVLRQPEGAGGSMYVHDELDVGDELLVRGPRNHFELAPSPRYAFVAGGIGVTPLVPMVEEAERSGANWTLVYCARSREALPFLVELQERYGNRVHANADDEVGLFDLATHFREIAPQTLVYACGPKPFLDATLSATAHWPADTVHFERFTPSEELSKPNEPFEVELALSGQVLQVPEDRSVLEVLREQGVPVLSSCSEGTCGTCEVTVLGGVVDHRDTVLDADERESGEMMMVCVSRAAAGERLVLDL